MDERSDLHAANLCAAIDAALRTAEAVGNTLVAALLAEAYDAASCDQGSIRATESACFRCPDSGEARSTSRFGPPLWLQYPPR